MESILTQLGVGGILAILVLREVFNFLKNHKNGKDGNSITRAEFDRHKDSVQYKDNCSEIVKRFDGIFNTYNENADSRHRELLSILERK